MLGCLWLVGPLIVGAVVMAALGVRGTGRNRQGPVEASRGGVGVPPVVWVTCVDDVDHAVADEVMAATIAAGAGEYATLCGGVALPASMLIPPARRCPRCVSVRAGSEVASSDAPAAAHRQLCPVEGAL